jgi:chromate transporter
VILNLAAFFAWHAFWPQDTPETPFAGSFDWFPVIAAFVALWQYKAGIFKVIGLCALLGLIYSSAP